MEIRLSLIAVILFAAANCLAQTAPEAQRRVVRYDGDVELETAPNDSIWAVDFVKTKDGRQAAFLKFIEQNWAKARQTLKTKGDIASFQVLSVPPDKTVEWDVLLVTEYKNQTTFDNRERLFAEVFKAQPTVLINGSDGKDLREIRFSRVFAQPIKSETADAMLAAQIANPEVAAARVPLENYIKAHATGKAEFVKQAFLPGARIMAFRDDKLVSLSVDEFAALFNGAPASDEAKRRRRIETLDIAGNAAVAKIVLDYPTVKFTDFMSLLKINGEWKIVNKSFYAEPK